MTFNDWLIYGGMTFLALAVAGCGIGWVRAARRAERWRDLARRLGAHPDLLRRRP